MNGTGRVPYWLSYFRYTTTLSRFCPSINGFAPPEQEEFRPFRGGNCASFRGRASGFRHDMPPRPRIPEDANAPIRGGAVTARRAPPARLRPGRAAGPARAGTPVPALARATPGDLARAALARGDLDVARLARPRPLARHTPADGCLNTHASWILVILINAVSHTWLSPAALAYCFTCMVLYQSGSPPEGPDRPLPGVWRGAGIPVSAGIPDGIRTSWRNGTPAGSRAGRPFPCAG
jgi:hypothetical protein